MSARGTVTKIYSVAGISMLLLAFRDVSLLQVGGGDGARTLGALLAINIFTSAVTDYFSNNRSWLSRTAARNFLILAGPLLLFSYKSIYFGYCAFLFSSLAYAYICGQQMVKKNYVFPNITLCFELSFQLLILFLFKTEGVLPYIWLRVLLSFTIFQIFSDSLGSNVIRTVNSTVPQVATIVTSLALAICLQDFFKLNPELISALRVRVTSYVAGAGALIFNFLADKLVIMKMNIGKKKLFLTGIGASGVAVFLTLAPRLFEFTPSFHELIVVTTILFAAISTFLFRIHSRLPLEKS